MQVVCSILPKRSSLTFWGTEDLWRLWMIPNWSIMTMGHKNPKLVKIGRGSKISIRAFFKFFIQFTKKQKKSIIPFIAQIKLILYLRIRNSITQPDKVQKFLILLFFANFSSWMSNWIFDQSWKHIRERPVRISQEHGIYGWLFATLWSRRILLFFSVFRFKKEMLPECGLSSYHRHL